MINFSLSVCNIVGARNTRLLSADVRLLGSLLGSFVKVQYSQKNIGIISIAQKCAVLFYPKLCILNFPVLEHCSAVRVS